MKKNILCYGDSNTWGEIPGRSNYVTGYRERFPINQRWTKLLQNILGEDYYVIEEGLGGRTTNVNNPDKPGRNGVEFLQVCLESHAPLHLVAIMLGTNDLNIKFKRNAQDIVNGVEELITCIKNSICGFNMLSPPEVLILFPPHPSHEKGFEGQFKGAIVISKELTELYQNMASKHKCYFLNLADSIPVDDIDGIHLGADGHRELSEILAKKISQIKLE